jgi:hypothetical protein
VVSQAERPTLIRLQLCFGDGRAQKIAAGELYRKLGARTADRQRRGVLTMENKKVAVFGIYQTPALAERGVDDLLMAGYSNEDISVLLPDNRGTRDFAHEKNTKAPEGTAVGVSAGGALGGALGLLAGIGMLAIPGVGPLIAAGPIMSALAGLGVGGAVGGVIGALAGMGMPEFEAKRYEGRIKAGGVLLSVHCDSAARIDRAKEVLKTTGADDIAAVGEAKADYPAVAQTAGQ